MTNPEAQRPSVLVVDDVEANLRAVEAVLDHLDCDVVSVQSGNEALRQLLKREFAALLLDVQMPEMDGHEVAHHARRNPSTKDVTILFLTATTAT
jgi:CheY-like chemotaxis protein